MTLLRQIGPDPFESRQGGRKFKVLLLSDSINGPELGGRIMALGGNVRVETELYSALASVIDDPVGIDVFVVDCDALGGIPAARRAVAKLGDAAERVTVLMVTTETVHPRDANALRGLIMHSGCAGAGLVQALGQALRRNWGLTAVK